jgi:hypothetical protein
MLCCILEIAVMHFRKDARQAACTLREFDLVAIIESVPKALRLKQFPSAGNPANQRAGTIIAVRDGLRKRGQVAQVVERSPEKAGVGGSTPSLATIISIG